MKIIFISDTHLQGLADENQQTLVNFLDQIKEDTNLLVILGDLFDFWMGNNKKAFEQYRPILDKLLEIKEGGIGIKYLEGNHDFFLGSFFSRDLKAEIYPDCLEMELEGKRIYLAHGDLVDSQDYRYRAFRMFLRNKLVFYLLRAAFPDNLGWKLANRFSRASRESRETVGKDYQRIFQEFALSKFEQGFDVVILGHSHQPEFLRTSIDGKEKLYVNLGYCREQLSYLIYEGGDFKLQNEKCKV